jgi:hypothetical protein
MIAQWWLSNRGRRVDAVRGSNQPAALRRVEIHRLPAMSRKTAANRKSVLPVSAPTRRDDQVPCPGESDQAGWVILLNGR